MTRQIPEKDWKIFRTIRRIALERFREQVLEEIVNVTRTEGQSAHEKYLKLYKLIKNRDRNMGIIFGDFRRSTALIRLRQMNDSGLLKPEEISEFKEETQAILRFLS